MRICGFFDEGCVSRQIVDTIHELYLLFGNRESSNIKGGLVQNFVFMIKV